MAQGNESALWRHLRPPTDATPPYRGGSLHRKCSRILTHHASKSLSPLAPRSTQ